MHTDYSYIDHGQWERGFLQGKSAAWGIITSMLVKGILGWSGFGLSPSCFLLQMCQYVLLSPLTDEQH